MFRYLIPFLLLPTLVHAQTMDQNKPLTLTVGQLDAIMKSQVALGAAQHAAQIELAPVVEQLKPKEQSNAKQVPETSKNDGSSGSQSSVR